MNRLPILMLVLVQSWWLVGCIGGPATVTPIPPTVDPGARATSPPDAETWDVRLDNTRLGLGFERVAFDILKPSGEPVRNAEVDVVFHRVVEGSGLTQRVSSGEALYFNSAVPGEGSWVAYNEFDSSGTWAIDINAEAADGSVGSARTEFEVVGRTNMPITGQPPPTTDTPAMEGDQPVSELTSDEEPLRSLYTRSLEEALALGLPVILQMSSPEHCETDACRAALTEFKAIAPRFDGRAAFIHVESRDLDNPTDMSETAEAWDLPSEPWTFFFDRDGFLAFRVEGAIERDELRLLVERVVQPQ